MVVFHSYVSLPEGIPFLTHIPATKEVVGRKYVAPYVTLWVLVGLPKMKVPGGAVEIFQSFGR